MARWLAAGTLAAAPVAQAQEARHPLVHREDRFAAAPASRPEWLPTLASALIPGSGQILRHQDRGAVYLVAEAFLLERFVSLWRQARQDERRYRDLAFHVARAAFSPVQTDTVFEYFEQMGVFVESGPYDTDAGPALAPPTDETTYNGRTWALARRTFFPNTTVPPDTASFEYRAALDFYRRRAVGPNFQWSWRTAALEQDLYRQSIASGDDRFRRASEQLGFLLANHFLSVVDAYVSERLSRKGTPIELEHRVRGGSRDGLRMDVGVELRLWGAATGGAR